MNIIINTTCKKYKKNNLTWDLVPYAQNEDVKKLLNIFRLEYVKILQKHIENNCKHTCEPILVGTTQNINYNSDIDININFNGKIKNNLDKIIEIYEQTYIFHSNIFNNNNYTEMFDINIYGTNFDIHNTCSKDTKCLKIIEEDQMQRIFAKGRLENTEFINKIKTNKSNSYQKFIKIYWEAGKNTKKAIYAFSMAKIFENDTYWSVGAYLHVVVGMKNLPKKLLLDSMYDNLGILVENILKENHPCAKGSKTMKIMKIAKYLERILDASQDKKHNHLLELSKKINILRKKSIHVSENNKDIQELRKILNILKKDNINQMAEKIIKYVVENIINTYEVQKET